MRNNSTSDDDKGVNAVDVGFKVVGCVCSVGLLGIGVARILSGDAVGGSEQAGSSIAEIGKQVAELIDQVETPTPRL